MFRPPFYVCDSISALPSAYDRISAYSMASVGEKGRKSPGGPGGGEGRTRKGAEEHLEGVEEPESPWERSRRHRLRIFFRFRFYDCFEHTACACHRLLRLPREAHYYCGQPKLATTWSSLPLGAHCHLSLLPGPRCYLMKRAAT